MNSIAARACRTTISDKKHPEIVAGQARPAMNIVGWFERRAVGWIELAKPNISHVKTTHETHARKPPA
jgi:hypothetical protein